MSDTTVILAALKSELPITQLYCEQENKLRYFTYYPKVGLIDATV